MLKTLSAAVLLTFAVACGSGGPSDSGSPAPADPEFAKVEPIIQKNCAGCHNGSLEPVLTPGATFKASTAKRRLQAGSMPPAPRKISDGDKAALLGYLGN